MKRTHIIILIGIVALIIGLLVFSVDFSTYDTINSAKNKQGKFVHLIAKLDKSEPITYDPIKNPNYLSFYAVDSWVVKRKLFITIVNLVIWKKVSVLY